MMAMADDKELQEKVFAYRIFETRVNTLLKQREVLATKVLEIESTLNSIDEIKKNKEDVLFPIGSEAYIFGKVEQGDKLIVEIGAGIALEKTFEEAKSVLEGRKNDIVVALENVQKDLEQSNAALEQLTPEIQKMMEEEEKKEAG